MQVKGISKDELEARNELVLALKDRIEVVPDGATSKPRPTNSLESSSSNGKIIFGSTLGDYCKNDLMLKFMFLDCLLMFYFWLLTFG